MQGYVAGSLSQSARVTRNKRSHKWVHGKKTKNIIGSIEFDENSVESS